MVAVPDEIPRNPNGEVMETTTKLNDFQADEARFIRDPGHWPSWPACPLKKSRPGGGMPDAGTLLDRQPISMKKVDPNHESLRKVYLMSIWDTHRGKKFSECETKVYESVEAMLLDGWQVD
jgi:hypothetical protein